MRDLPQMQKIYARARALMAANGNPTQWGNEFPRESMIEDDIANQRTMLLVDTCNGHERILAQFALCPGEDPTYAKIDGAWLDNDAYVTIHRIAASGLVRHAARDCIRWALKHYGNVRADTHPNNKAMQHVLESSGFARCGLIQLLDRPVDTTRIAYQRHEWGVWLSADVFVSAVEPSGLHWRSLLVRCIQCAQVHCEWHRIGWLLGFEEHGHVQRQIGDGPILAYVAFA